MGPYISGINCECRPEGYSGAGTRKSEAVGDGEEKRLAGCSSAYTYARIGLKAMLTILAHPPGLRRSANTPAPHMGMLAAVTMTHSASSLEPHSCPAISFRSRPGWPTTADGPWQSPKCPPRRGKTGETFDSPTLGPIWKLKYTTLLISSPGPAGDEAPRKRRDWARFRRS